MEVRKRTSKGRNQSQIRRLRRATWLAGLNPTPQAQNVHKVCELAFEYIGDGDAWTAVALGHAMLDAGYEFFRDLSAERSRAMKLSSMKSSTAMGTRFRVRYPWAETGRC